MQFFRQVEASSDYLFNYKDQDVADIRVSVKVADASIQEVMDLALARTSLTYTVKGRHVIIGQSAARSAGTPGTDSRPVALTGRVTDEKGMPFVGVTVIQEGTTNGCVTDADGNYRISVPVGASVSFSYIGYKTQRTHVGVQTRVDIRLEPSDISLETVVVTALGIKKAEKSLGYSLQQVNSDAFDKVKTDNPINALNGKVAGLTVNTRAGILEDPPIKLRGETPIYVINGTPVTYYRGVSSDDIESITVLKGPQAAVLYGSRGANGAILITTKTGDDIGEKTEITLNSSTMFTAGYLNPARAAEHLRYGRFRPVFLPRRQGRRRIRRSVDLGPETRPERPHHAERLFRDRTVQQPDRPQDGEADSDAFRLPQGQFPQFFATGPHHEQQRQHLP